MNIDFENIYMNDNGEIATTCKFISKKEAKKYWPNNQPKRSKREDDIMYLKCRCGKYKHIFADKIHMDRCGALNTMET